MIMIMIMIVIMIMNMIMRTKKINLFLVVLTPKPPRGLPNNNKKKGFSPRISFSGTTDIHTRRLRNSSHSTGRATAIGTR